MPLREWLTELFFEWGAPLYARKLAWGPEARLREQFVDFLPLSPGACVLDVGCGPAHVARRLVGRGAQVVAVDRSRRMLRWARRAHVQAGTNGIRFTAAAAEHLPFPPARFDLTFATTVLYLLPNKQAALAEMRRVTRPGGWVATLDPAAALTVEKMRTYARTARLNPRETRQLVQWAYAAQWYGGFQQEELAGLYGSLGFENTIVEQRLNDLVLFACGRVRATGVDA